MTIPGPIPDFTPWVPSFNQAMPEGIFDAVIAANGIRLGWLRAHTCPCTYSGGTPGSPNPSCVTCRARGIYWDKPAVPFVGMLTFVTTQMSAPTEVASHIDPVVGAVQMASPTLSIPRNGNLNESTVWAGAGRFDAYVEMDGSYRTTATFVQQHGQTNFLPYDLGVVINSVTVWNPATSAVVPLAVGAWTLTNGSVSLVDYPDGTAFVVDYQTLPVYVADSPQHIRPFGQGSQNLPKRFQVKALDLWTRAQALGDGPMTP